MTSFCQTLEFGSVLHLRLLSNVKNTRDLRSKVMTGQLSCALIKPKLITDPFQIVIAANKAVVKGNLSSIITKSVYTEILFNLSTSKNITQGLAKFGVGDDDTDILVAVISIDEEEVQEIIKQIDGNLSSMEDLKKLSDNSEIRRAYSVQDEELRISSLIDSVVSRIAAKDCL